LSLDKLASSDGATHPQAAVKTGRPQIGQGFNFAKNEAATKSLS
jgi:hypothetical protein